MQSVKIAVCDVSPPAEIQGGDAFDRVDLCRFFGKHATRLGLQLLRRDTSSPARIAHAPGVARR
jgi:hypothetical protein